MTPSFAEASEGRPGDGLDWQAELDSAMSVLDSRLSNPRRRAPEVAPEPAAPQAGHLEITNEMIDEIAWRVSAQMRRTATVGAADGFAPSPGHVATPLPEPVKPKTPTIGDGISVVIRVRRPLFHWKFWRRRSRLRRESLVTFSDYRIT